MNHEKGVGWLASGRESVFGMLGAPKQRFPSRMPRQVPFVTCVGTAGDGYAVQDMC